jgi:dihydroorotase-like cyclic amidohydrolase
VDTNSGKALLTLFTTLSRNPARILGVEGKRGSIAVGAFADLVIWSPEELAESSSTKSAYANDSAFGRVVRVYVRG